MRVDRFPADCHPARMFALEPSVARKAPLLAAEFAERGRVSIAGLLDDTVARELHAGLRARDDWRQAVVSEREVYELDRATRSGLSAADRETLDQSVYAGARQGFQARYETIRVPDEAAARGRSEDPLARVAQWLSTDPMRAFLRTVIGDRRMTFADAQGTAYSPGDFLTGHDDIVEGKNRLAAYVLGLTPTWRLEWGGLLMFHEAGATRASAVMPGFNELNVFRVGIPHSVSEVTRAAAYRRYSVTGWLRY